jgi:predicted nuclease with TOPRIM domain
MKSKEIQEDIKELQEKADLAEQLEELHGWANQAKNIIIDILGRVSDLQELGFQDYDSLESIINTIINEVESKLEAL